MRVLIEGNIGAGKSSFINYLNSQFQGDVLANAKFIPEPIEKWQNVDGHNLLNLMYENPIKYGIAFQMYTMLTSFKTHMETAGLDLAFIERSWLSGKHCFLPAMVAQGSIDEPTSAVFNEWYTTLSDHLKFTPDVIIYIKTSPHVIFERVKKRNRKEEEKIDISYLILLDALHEKWLYEMIWGGNYIPADESLVFGNAIANKTLLITVDGDLNREKIKTEYEKCVQQVKSLFKKKC